jgi:hypothetical protein
MVLLFYALTIWVVIPAGLMGIGLLARKLSIKAPPFIAFPIDKDGDSGLPGA